MDLAMVASGLQHVDFKDVVFNIVLLVQELVTTEAPTLQHVFELSLID